MVLKAYHQLNKEKFPPFQLRLAVTIYRGIVCSHKRGMLNMFKFMAVFERKSRRRVKELYFLTFSSMSRLFIGIHLFI